MAKDYEIWIVMKYVKGHSLSVMARLNLEEVHIAYFAGEILKALKYLHERDIAHRDINPSNIICSLDGEIKIIDFGSAADVHDGPRYQILGQPYYTAPEMIKRLGHNCLCDIWSLGAVLLELFLHEPPISISSVLCLFTACTKGFAHLIPSAISASAKMFLQGCLTIETEKRPSAEGLLHYNWVNPLNNLKPPTPDILLAANVSQKSMNF